MPKQLLGVIQGRSLLQLAFERATTLVDPDHVLVCAGRAHADVIHAQLPDLPAANLLAEPVGRDSLAAVTWSVATAAARDPDAVVAILTADQIIAPQAEFTATVRHALDVAAQDRRALVTCGVVPTSAHTGYGYLHVGEPSDSTGTVFHVTRFAEKPNRDLAQAYLADGGWWWNSGMFCWNARTFLEQVRDFAPDMADGVDRIVASPDVIGEIYPRLPKVSVDYAIMEPVSAGASTAHILAVGLRADWADIGGYQALARYLADEDGNAIEGSVVALDCSSSLILNRTEDGRLVAAYGLKDMIVVQDDDVTLVCPKDYAEKVKKLVQMARERGDRYA